MIYDISSLEKGIGAKVIEYWIEGEWFNYKYMANGIIIDGQNKTLWLEAHNYIKPIKDVLHHRPMTFFDQELDDLNNMGYRNG